jgi:hypothetical protein
MFVSGSGQCHLDLRLVPPHRISSPTCRVGMPAATVILACRMTWAPQDVSYRYDQRIECFVCIGDWGLLLPCHRLLPWVRTKSTLESLEDKEYKQCPQFFVKWLSHIFRPPLLDTGSKRSTAHTSAQPSCMRHQSPSKLLTISPHQAMTTVQHGLSQNRQMSTRIGWPNIPESLQFDAPQNTH